MTYFFNRNLVFFIAHKNWGIGTLFGYSSVWSALNSRFSAAETENMIEDLACYHSPHSYFILLLLFSFSFSLTIASFPIQAFGTTT
jgi:hypothetical protein